MNELQICDPFPIIFKKTFDFGFDENPLRKKCLDYLDLGNTFINRTKIITSEIKGGITTAGLEKTRYSNETPPHNWEEFESFKNFVYDTTEEISKIWCLNENVDKIIARSWMNTNTKNSFVSEHAHHGSLMVVTSYLEVPENSGKLLVKNPYNPYKFSEPVHPYYYSDEGGEDGLEWRSIDVKTNDVLFFPGWLLHKTEPNLTNNDRHVMTWNIAYVPDFGKNKNVSPDLLGDYH